MKKLLVTLICAVMAIGLNAQNTYNVRLGYGGVNLNVDGKLELHSLITGGFQANFPVKPHSPITFSPALELGYASFASEYDDSYFHIAFPLHLGYKIPMANKCIFYPKAGLKAGYISSTNDSFYIGPSAEVALEIKNFIVAVNGSFPVSKTNTHFVNWDEYNKNIEKGIYWDIDKKYSAYNVTISVGYKF